MSKRTKCPVCKGTGSVWSGNINLDDRSLPDYASVQIKQPCPVCSQKKEQTS